MLKSTCPAVLEKKVLVQFADVGVSHDFYSLGPHFPGATSDEFLCTIAASNGTQPARSWPGI
jgi:hypothetical protein